jgi:predicted dehydrogenase
MVAFGGKHPHYHPLVIYGSKGSLRTDELFLEKYETNEWIKLPGYTYDHTENCIESISDFVDKVRNGGTPKANAVESAKAVAICEAAIESYQSGKPVKVSREFEIGSM